MKYDLDSPPEDNERPMDEDAPIEHEPADPDAELAYAESER